MVQREPDSYRYLKFSKLMNGLPKIPPLKSYRVKARYIPNIGIYELNKKNRTAGITIIYSFLFLKIS